MSDQNRKLAAIVFTDTAGFSALSSKDENYAIELINTQRNIIQPLLNTYNGTLHKETGDGFLLTFLTVTSAVEFGIDFQRAIKQIDGLNVRIGIHEGEITFQNNDVFGDDVNISARIEPYSPIGGIAISEKVKLELGSLPEYTTEFIDEPDLKGIKQPIKIYCISSHGLAHPNKIVGPKSIHEQKSGFRFNILGLTGVILTIIGGIFWIWYGFGGISQGSGVDNKIFQSIAVLYLENLSNDPKDENICAALTNSITTAFTRLGIFDVKPRTDVLKFRKKVTSHKEINDVLGVDVYIEGSLIKSPDNNEYTANISLIDANEGNNIWANEYNKTAGDISNISNTIASEVAQFLSGDQVRDFEELKDVQNIDDVSFALMGKGINLLDSEKYKPSISVFDSVLLIEPDNMRAIYSKGRALEGIGQYDDAINSYNQIITNVNPSSRTTNIWGHPDIINQGLNRINVKDELMISEKFNIQIGAFYRKDKKISEIFALDLNTNEIIWKKIYPFSAVIEIVENNLVVSNSVLARDVDGAVVYIHSLKLGALLYTREFPKEYSDQKVIIQVLFNKGSKIPAFQDVVNLYIIRDEYRSLVMINPQTNQILLEKVIPMEDVIEGNPNISLLEDSGKNYLFHEKGLNQYLFEINSGELIWNKNLPDDSYKIKVYNNQMLTYSKNETGVVLQNIVSQKNIGKFDMESPVIRGFFWKENIILHTTNNIASIKTYKPFLRSLHNWTQDINKNEEIRHIFDIHDNLFLFTKTGDLYCINGKTGEVINYNQIGHNIFSFHFEDENDPAYNSSKSFIIYADGFLIGLDTNSGKTLWKIRELNIHLDWVYGRIVVIGNKVIIIKKPENKNNIVIKAYNRMTGELLWRSEEDLLLGIGRKNAAEGWGYSIKDQVFGYVHQNSLYIASFPTGFLYAVDISWRPDKNYIPQASVYNNLAYCYKKINNNSMAEEMLNNIINVLDQQNEVAFEQLSDLYLANSDTLNYIKNQIGFHELVFYNDIKRGNIETQLMQTSGLRWVKHFKRAHDFAVHFPDENIAVSGFCSDEGGCTFKYYRTRSGILIGEDNLNLLQVSNVMALNNMLVFIGNEKTDGDEIIVSLYEIDPRSRNISNKIFLWDELHYIDNIYHFGGIYIVESDHTKFDDRHRYLTAIDMNNQSILWENKYQYNTINIQEYVDLVQIDELIIYPQSEELQAINLYSGEIEWLYQFDDIDGIKYIDENCIYNDNLYFLTTDDEFAAFDLANKEILFISDEMYFDYKLNIAFLNHNNMLGNTYDGKLILYKYNGKDVVKSWLKDFDQPIRIYDVIDDTIYIQYLEDGLITAINIDNPENKKTIHTIWNSINRSGSLKIFIDGNSYGIYNKRALYFINI